MQTTLNSPNSESSSPLCKSLQLKRSKIAKLSKHVHSQELPQLSQFNIELSPTFEKKLTIETLTTHTERIVQHVYNEDPLGIGHLIGQFLRRDLIRHRQRVQQRLSLQKYLGESLKFKQFAQIEVEMQRQWRKNVLFFSLTTIWVAKMQAYKFSAFEEFINEYRKQILLVANLTHFYFRDALTILDHKGVSTYLYLLQETSHHILNSLPDWKDLYHGKLIPLLQKRNKREQSEMDMNYDINTLQINRHYLDPNPGNDCFPATIATIRNFAAEHTIHRKILLLKQIRSNFIREIQGNRQLIATRDQDDTCSPLQKDDIISCMIYCIITGQIKDLQYSVQSLMELLGPNNQLLSRKGVDSYRADLQSAVMYLCSQSEPTLITVPQSLRDKEENLV